MLILGLESATAEVGCAIGGQVAGPGFWLTSLLVLAGLLLARRLRTAADRFLFLKLSFVALLVLPWLPTILPPPAAAARGDRARPRGALHPAGSAGIDARAMSHGADPEQCRAAMVRTQIEARGVCDARVLQAMRELPRERLIIGVQAVYGAQGALDATVKYVQERQAFGQAIGQFQNTRFTLAQCASDIAAAEAFLNASVAAYERGELTPEAASALKLHTTEVMGRVTDACLQLFGGYGYMKEYPIARLYADARVQRIYGGTNEIMKELASRFL